MIQTKLLLQKFSGERKITYGLPRQLWKSPFSTCIIFEISDVLRPGPNWISLIEDIFDVAGTCPKRGYARSSGIDSKSKEGLRTHGSWRRIRGKASEISSTLNAINVIDAQTDFKYIPGDHPNDMYCSIKRKQMLRSVSYSLNIVACHGLLDRVQEVIDLIMYHRSSQFSVYWGGQFAFPEEAGGPYYLGGMMGYVPKRTKELGNSSVLLRNYFERFNRPRIRINSGYLYSRGYMREIYDQNFLSPAHMAAPLLGGTVMDYVKRTGTLEKLDLPYDLWLWSLNPDDHAKACLDWEESGLVLAAEREPIDLSACVAPCGKLPST